MWDTNKQKALYVPFFFFRVQHRKDEIDLTTWPKECGETIRFLEHVQVRVNLNVWPRGDLIISLKSPQGTLSHLTQHRPYDMFRKHSTHLTNWAILTLHNWGEDPQGRWELSAHMRNGRGRHRKSCIFLI